MKRVVQRLIFTILIITMLSVVLYYYFSNIFLPIKFKHFVTQKAEDFLDRRVTIGEIDFQMPKGFTFTDIVIFQKDFENRPFFSVEEISFNILMTSFLKKKQIIIPFLKIKKPFVHVERLDPVRWNFSDLLEKRKPSTRKSNFSVFFGKVTLDNGQINFVDQTPKEPFIESLAQIDLQLSVSLLQQAKFSFSSFLPKQDGIFHADGTLDIKKKSVHSTINLQNIPLAQYLALFLKNDKCILKNGAISSAGFEVSFQDNRAQLQGNLDFANADVQLFTTKNLTGNLQLTDAFLLWENNQLSGKGNVSFKKAFYTFPPQRKLQGDLKASVSSIAFANRELTLRGNLDFQNGILILDEKKKVQGSLTATNASFNKKNQDLTIDGKAVLNQGAFIFDDDKKGRFSKSF